jgi:cold-inducible RNA-binding protein
LNAGVFVKVYVGNISKSMTDAQLNDLFKPFGKLDSASVAKDRATGEARGFGFVEFPNDEEARAAIAALDGKEVGGRTLKVNESRPKGGTRLATPGERA